MLGYLENEKFEDHGVMYPFKTHIQTSFGPSQIVDVHYHMHIEILYCLSGQYRVFIGGEHAHFKKGDMVVINAMEAHSVICLSEGCNEYVVIRFEPEFLYTSIHAIFETKYILPFTAHHGSHQRLFDKVEIQATFVPELILEISKEDLERRYGFELAIRTHLGRIFLWILRFWHDKGLDLTNTTPENLNNVTMTQLNKAFEFVGGHFDEHISAFEVAKLCNMSYSHFSRVFKQVVGRSFSDYVNFVRLSRAQQMLMSSEMSITEVALAVGFSTASYFIDQFKAKHQMTPLQFRKQFWLVGHKPQA